MVAEIWGPMFWNLLFDVAHFYRSANDNTVSKDVAYFFNLTQFVLPCENCRKHYSEFLLSCDKDLCRCPDIGREFLFPVKRQINFRLLKPNISLKTYETRRQHFTLSGNGYALEKLILLLQKKMLKKDVTMSKEKIDEWCAVTRKIVQEIPGYGPDPEPLTLRRSIDSPQDKMDSTSSDTGIISP